MNPSKQYKESKKEIIKSAEEVQQRLKKEEKKTKALQNLYDKIDVIEQMHQVRTPIFISNEEMECWMAVGELIELWKEFKLHK